MTLKKYVTILSSCLMVGTFIAMFAPSWFFVGTFLALMFLPHDIDLDQTLR